MTTKNAWCHVCRTTVAAFVETTGKDVVAPAVAAALGGALGHGGRKNASLGEVALGAVAGLGAGLLINAASAKAQQWVCGECHGRVA